MPIFVALAFFGLILLLGGSIFGHDHDHDGGFDHDHDHDGDHEGGSEPSVSIFSTKVIGTFVMGFGAAGFVASYYGCNWLSASLVGLGFGVLLGLVMYAVLRLIYGQQSTSMVRPAEFVGRFGVVTTSIDAGSVGSVDVSCGDQTKNYLARGVQGQAFQKGDRVKVVEYVAGEMLVDNAN